MYVGPLGLGTLGHVADRICLPLPFRPLVQHYYGEHLFNLSTKNKFCGSIDRGKSEQYNGIVSPPGYIYTYPPQFPPNPDGPPQTVGVFFVLGVHIGVAAGSRRAPVGCGWYDLL